MLRHSDGLCALQMRVTGHNGILRSFCLLADGGNKVAQELLDFLDLIAQIQTNIKCHLVVTTTGGMQFFANVANARGQLSLYEHMNVLSLGVDGELATLDVIENGSQAVNDCRAFLFCDDAAKREHGGVFHRAFDILTEHTSVYLYRRIEVVSLF